MKDLLEKLNYKGQERIALINAENNCTILISNEVKDIKIDREIDPRYPYDFIIIFVRSISEVDSFAPVALHNLVADGILWLCFPKKTSNRCDTDLDRNHGWNTLKNSGFQNVRVVNIDENWYAMRFRNIKFIKSIS